VQLSSTIQTRRIHKPSTLCKADIYHDIRTEIGSELCNYGRHSAAKKKNKEKKEKERKKRTGVPCKDVALAERRTQQANTQQYLHTDILQRYAPSL
jgi:hypothetical protein